MAEEPQAKVGDIVLYTMLLMDHESASKLVTYPGMVTSLDNDGPNLVVFCDHKIGGTSMIAHPIGAPYSKEQKRGTWCFPTDVPEA